jgi:hypothetical protein
LNFFSSIPQETINSASSITQSFSSELLDGQRKLLALVASGNTKAHNTNSLQPINGPLSGPQEVNADNFSSPVTLLIAICLFYFISQFVNMPTGCGTDILIIRV